MKKITLLLFFLIFFSVSFKLNAACVWKSKIGSFSVWDTCKKGGGQVTISNGSCLYYYKWTINGNTYTQGLGATYSSFSFQITKNGTYTICVKVTDTCNNCDTTLCASFTVTCFKNCNWKSKLAYIHFGDTCRGYNKKNTLNGDIIFSTGTNSSCFRYQWYVNGVVKGTGVKFSYNITQNGTYSQYLKITDTCNNCDTIIYRNSSATFNCISSCNWKGRTPVLGTSDTCSSSASFIWGSIIFNGNYNNLYKYAWTVNGSPAGNNYPSQTFSVSSNGTYTICVKVTDTVNKCDTTFCKQVTVYCTKNCNWKSRSPYVYFNDSCNGSGKRNKINAGISIGTPGCYKYVWTVNGFPVNTITGYSYWLVYDVTKNGTYTVCVKAIDTCNNCDTTFCSTKTFTCFASCSWPSKVSSVFMADTCRGYGKKNTLNGNVTFKTGVNTSCFKYQWSVNGVIQGTGTQFTYNVTQNGTYYQCLKIKDTCNNCDTTICRYVTIGCIVKPCAWKTSLKLYFSNKCYNNKDTLNAYASGYNGINCPQFTWTLNGVKKSTSSYLYMPITQNGTYSICVKVRDTCNQCDTTLCSTFVVNCLQTKKCNNWKGRSPSFTTWDTCVTNRSRNSLNGSLTFGTPGCYKYQWYVSSQPLPGKSTFSHKVTVNGTYYVCVKVTDTCNNCDTTFCAARTITCINACNFKSGAPYFTVGDTCSGTNSSLSGAIFLSNLLCLKYLWTVNGVGISNSYNFNTYVYSNGNYKVCVKVTDTCNKCDTTFCTTKTINCSGLGLKGKSGLLSGTKLYPNPASQLLNIDRDGDACSFEITDVLGAVVYKGELKAGNNTLMVDNWTNGLYILRTFEASGTRTFKIVVSR